MNLVNTTFKSTEEMINKLQQLKGKAKLRFYKSISKYYDNMNFIIGEDTFAKNAQGFSKIYHEVWLIMKFLQTKPQVKVLEIKFYDLYYTVIENREDKEIIDNQYENDFINFIDNVPNHYVGRQNDKEILK